VLPSWAPVHRQGYRGVGGPALCGRGAVAAVAAVLSLAAARTTVQKDIS
jgi:hypothetical protein